MSFCDCDCGGKNWAVKNIGECLFSLKKNFLPQIVEKKGRKDIF